MKKGIHPKQHNATIRCASCSNEFETLTTLPSTSLVVDVCANCHPFYTGEKGTGLSARGRAEKLSAKFESGKSTLSAKPVEKPKRVKKNKTETVTSFDELDKKS